MSCVLYDAWAMEYVTQALICVASISYMYLFTLYGGGVAIVVVFV